MATIVCNLGTMITSNTLPHIHTTYYQKQWGSRESYISATDTQLHSGTDTETGSQESHTV